MKQTKETLSIELDGKINLVTRKGKKVTREELDGMVCLEALLRVITRALEEYEAAHKRVKPVKTKRR